MIKLKNVGENISDLCISLGDVDLTVFQESLYESWKNGDDPEKAFATDIERYNFEEESDFLKRKGLEERWGEDVVRLKYYVKLFNEQKVAYKNEKFKFLIVDDGNPHFVMSNYGRLFHILSERSLVRGNNTSKKYVIELKRKSNGTFGLYIGSNSPLNRKSHTHLGISYSVEKKTWKRKVCKYVNVSYYDIMRSLWTEKDLEGTSICGLEKRKIIGNAETITPNKWAGIVLRHEATGEVMTFESKVSAAVHFGINKTTFRTKVFFAKTDEVCGKKYILIEEEKYFIEENNKPNWLKKKLEGAKNIKRIISDNPIDYPAVQSVIETIKKIKWKFFNPFTLYSEEICACAHGEVFSPLRT